MNVAPPDTTVSVSVSPATASVLVAAGTKIQATVTGTSDTSVAFSVVEGVRGGQVTSTGEYVAPSTSGIYHVRATSTAVPSRYAEATITVRDYSNSVARVSDASDAHQDHTASLLADGSVLIVGGSGYQLTHRIAERYIPSQGQFQNSGSLAQSRVEHTAAVLASGKVLVSGGYDPYGSATQFDPAFRSSEIFDPATQTFTAGPDMVYPRRAHRVVQLRDGRLFYSGGIQLVGSGFGATPNTELYDPATNTFADAGRMNTGRWMHTATVLQDGRVLLVGGRDNNCGVSCAVYSLASAEIFDPATGRFTATGSLHLSRYAHTATLLPDGRVLVLGGETTDQAGSDQIRTGEIYDPSTGSFSLFGTLLDGRSHHTITLLNNGEYLIAGGKNGNGTITGTTEIFDTTTGLSTSGPAMNDWRYRHTATRLLSGEVLIVGGNNSGGPVVPTDLFR